MGPYSAFVSGSEKKPPDWLEEVSEAVSQTFNDTPLPQGPGSLVADSISLRKSWSRTPSYWIEVVYTPLTRLFTVKRRWKWLNRRTNELVEGDAQTGGIKSLPLLYDRFTQILTEKQAQDYLFAGRISQGWSPFYYHEFAGCDGPKDKAAVESPEKRRKPKWDAW